MRLDALLQRIATITETLAPTSTLEPWLGTARGGIAVHLRHRPRTDVDTNPFPDGAWCGREAAHALGARITLQPCSTCLDILRDQAGAEAARALRTYLDERSARTSPDGDLAR